MCPEALLLPEWTGWTLWTRKSQPGFLLSVQTTGHTPAQEQGAPREKEAPGSAAGVGEDGDSPGPPFLDSATQSYLSGERDKNKHAMTRLESSSTGKMRSTVMIIPNGI